MVNNRDSFEEGAAREKIGEVLERLAADRSLGMETRSKNDNDSVGYHVENIFKAGGGIWNERIAKDYIENLKTEVAQPM